MSILGISGVARLYWEPGRGGSATRKGRTVPLAGPPDLGSGPVYGMDYVSGSGLATVTRAVHDQAGDMRPDEIAAAEGLLREFVPSVAGAL